MTFSAISSMRRWTLLADMGMSIILDFILCLANLRTGHRSNREKLKILPIGERLPMFCDAVSNAIASFSGMVFSGDKDFEGVCLLPIPGHCMLN